MLHEPAPKKQEFDAATPYKTRLGLWMFLLYALIYLGFIAINVIKPSLMESIILWGLNLATVYGVSLILLAFILAVIYNSLSSKKEKELNFLEEEK